MTETAPAIVPAVMNRLAFAAKLGISSTEFGRRQARGLIGPKRIPNFGYRVAEVELWLANPKKDGSLYERGEWEFARPGLMAKTAA